MPDIRSADGPAAAGHGERRFLLAAAAIGTVEFTVLLWVSR